MIFEEVWYHADADRLFILEIDESELDFCYVNAYASDGKLVMRALTPRTLGRTPPPGIPLYFIGEV